MLLELIRLAASYGYEVHAAHLKEDVCGYTSFDEGRIYYDMALTPHEVDVTLAHEIGHVFHEHTGDTPREEYQAELFAAQLLIDPARFAEAESIDPDRHHIADELGVTADLVEFYERHCLTRLQGVTYARPRHGRGLSALRRFIPSSEVAYG